jgi:hypothetical protein
LTISAGSSGGNNILFLAGSVQLPNGTTSTGPSLVFNNGTSFGFGSKSASEIFLSNGTANLLAFGNAVSTALTLGDTSLIGWTSSTDATGTKDTTVCRNAAGIVEIGNSTTCNTAGSLSLTNVTTAITGLYECTHGSNATCGVATLASGTVTVSTTAAATLAASGGAGGAIRLTLQSCSSCGTLSVGTVTNGTSFVINSSNGSDASLVFWQIEKIN